MNLEQYISLVESSIIYYTVSVSRRLPYWKVHCILKGKLCVHVCVHADYFFLFLNGSSFPIILY